MVKNQCNEHLLTHNFVRYKDQIFHHNERRKLEKAQEQYNKLINLLCNTIELNQLLINEADYSSKRH